METFGGGGRPTRRLARDLPQCLGQRVAVRGWARAGDGGALEVWDHTGAVRVSANPGAGEVPPGSAVEVDGVVFATAGDPGGFGLDAEAVRVAGPADPGLPALGGATLGERLDWRHLDLRRPQARLVFEVQTTLEGAMRAAWAAAGFIELHSPKLLPTGPRHEDLFSLPYFDRKAWLAQSPQFYKQMAMSAGFDRVFEIGPVFRVEPAISGRHATEFTSIDVEMAWIDSEADVMAFAEGWLASSLAAVAERHGAEVEARFGAEVKAPPVPFPRISLRDAWAMVGPSDHPSDEDLQPADERLLGQRVAAETGHEFVWVTEYPAALRPFYHMLSSDGSPLSRSFDLLWKGLEVASGAQREHRYHHLVAQAQGRDLPLAPIRHFLDFFRFGCPPHGGFGFGLARLLMCMLDVDDMREVTFLPRDRNRLSP